MKIGILGVGAMGSALYKNLNQAFDVTAFDHDKEKLSSLIIKKAPETLEIFLDSIDCLIIAIKPQSLDLFQEECQTDISQKLIISVMAGVSLEKLERFTRSKRIVRTMPNLAVSIKSGYIGWIATKGTLELDKKFIKQLLSPLGISIEVPNEDLLHDITALAGSGPAYFFYLTELLSKEAEKSGLSKSESQILVKQVIKGAALLMDQSEKSPKEWKKQVRSKKGTTDAALNKLEQEGFDKIFHEAVNAATQRSKELEHNG